MQLDLNGVDWQHAKEALDKIFGERSLSIGENGRQGTVSSEDYLMAILKVYNDEDYLSLHLRASLIPTAAAYIAAILGVATRIIIDECFEYDFDGNLLTGERALKFASENIKDLWFGFEQKKTGEKFKRPEHLN